ncbi:MAG: chorismate mutase [Rhodospirillaceae bacterium]
MISPPLPLEELRQRIDHIDDRIHDLLMERAEVVKQIGVAKGGGYGMLRPAREATILRRLAARHHGELAVGVLLRMWRELISGLTQLQGRFTVAVYAPGDHHGFWDLARDHFGGFTPMSIVNSPLAAVRAVAEGTAMVGVVPLPADDDIDPWWRFINGDDERTPHVVARLPFAGRSNYRSEDRDAFVIALVPHEPSATGPASFQNDRSLLRIEVSGDLSRGRLKDALEAVGLPPTSFCSWLGRGGGAATLHLVEIAGFVGTGDPRLAVFVERLLPLSARLNAMGGYAVPLSHVLDGQQP